MSSMTAASDTNGSVQKKHRACDECRTRKLACSKESDGCSRCKREGIACHYSPQKPMGRPRKRPRDQTDDDNALPDIAADNDARAPKTIMTEMPPPTSDPGMDFINLLTADYGSGPTFEPLQTIHHVNVQEHERPWGFGQHLVDLDFDMAPPEQQDQTMHQHQPYTSLNIDPALFGASAAATSPSDPSPTSSDPVPGLSPPSASASTPESSTSCGGTTTASCACTATLYLALDSMQKLPSDVTDGVCQARHAARTAWQVVNCPVCSRGFELPQAQHHPEDLQQHLLQAPTKLPQPQQPAPRTTMPNVNIHNFQNLMLLGTLIPSIVHAYETILAAVDRETCQAQRDRRPLLFRLHGLGGMWGPLGDAKGVNQCGADQAFGHREMEPAMWRLTVRALLKLDVYGLSHGGACNNMGKSGVGRLDFDATGGGGEGVSSGAMVDGSALHLGLKDIVTLMENRARARHAVMDALVLAGSWPEYQQQQCPSALQLHEPGETPTCQRIIALAKRSIDRLVIA